MPWFLLIIAGVIGVIAYQQMKPASPSWKELAAAAKTAAQKYEDQYFQYSKVGLMKPAVDAARSAAAEWRKVAEARSHFDLEDNVTDALQRAAGNERIASR